MARMFFGHLTGEALSSWLDRTLSTHVGPGRRFAHVGERSAFDAALNQYCAEATRMIREFSGGWYWKTLQRRGRIDTSDAAAFAAVALINAARDGVQDGSTKNWVSRSPSAAS